MEVNAVDYDRFSRSEAIELLKNAGITGYAKKKRADCIKALKAHHASNASNEQHTSAHVSSTTSPDANNVSVDESEEGNEELEDASVLVDTVSSNIADTTYTADPFDDETGDNTVVVDTRADVTSEQLEESLVMADTESEAYLMEADDARFIESHQATDMESEVADLAHSRQESVSSLNQVDPIMTDIQTAALTADQSVSKAIQISPTADNLMESETVVEWLDRKNLGSLVPVFEKEELLEWDVIKDITLPSLQTLSLPLGAVLKFMRAKQERFNENVADKDLRSTNLGIDENIESLVSRLVEARLTESRAVSSKSATSTTVRPTLSRQPISRTSIHNKEKDSAGLSDRSIPLSSTGSIVKKRPKNVNATLNSTSVATKGHSVTNSKPESAGSRTASGTFNAPSQSMSATCHGTVKPSASKSTPFMTNVAEVSAASKSSIPAIFRRPTQTRVSASIADAGKKTPLRTSKSVGNFGLSRKDAIVPPAAEGRDVAADPAFKTTTAHQDFLRKKASTHALGSSKPNSVSQGISKSSGYGIQKPYVSAQSLNSEAVTTQQAISQI
ncbi:hypothetical protein BATDEDRAFT_35434 [Batrachochytrium dendrobatidis JAM81]|uniref:SAM domain-containing protein n=1 Tax=Batrachochytrium dendrobatidis (strain JAM81 / FGSC 10211) TaxID=684364 RepID=F4P634_BATDJ|nr:uncharacterized protein BATDEDRAFT_35434 [Batrachochytrium dendrobatidis JAM81]EGF79535.1 hypothetical protein BATDEDRAFT_35434 [Batrachochytrium dendrobatidis JAM81]|eukprot:XP_006679998.1 hypothetical protein BATDEDRAFT_35434 [Batrachochytrium dendrobatidis JAM81]